MWHLQSQTGEKWMSWLGSSSCGPSRPVWSQECEWMSKIYQTQHNECQIVIRFEYFFAFDKQTGQTDAPYDACGGLDDLTINVELPNDDKRGWIKMFIILNFSLKDEFVLFHGDDPDHFLAEVINLIKCQNFIFVLFVCVEHHISSVKAPFFIVRHRYLQSLDVWFSELLALCGGKLLQVGGAQPRVLLVYVNLVLMFFLSPEMKIH